MLTIPSWIILPRLITGRIRRLKAPLSRLLNKSGDDPIITALLSQESASSTFAEAARKAKVQDISTNIASLDLADEKLIKTVFNRFL